MKLAALMTLHGHQYFFYHGKKEQDDLIRINN